MIKCFLSHPFDIDPALYRNMLEKVGVEVLDIYDLPTGNNIKEDIKEKIRESLFVVAVVNATSLNVAFEIGLSEGLNKPVLILNQGKTDLPLNFLGTTVIDILPNKELLLEKAIGDFVSTLTSEKRELKRRIHSSVLKTSELQKIGMQLRMLRIKPTHAAAERIAYSYFEALGISTVGSELNVGGNRARADFAIWVPEIDSFVKNPILVEIKVGPLTKQGLHNSILQLKEWVIKADLQMGILLYLDSRGQRFDLSVSKLPFIISADFEDIANQTMTLPLSKYLLEIRNRIMHGGSIK